MTPEAVIDRLNAEKKTWSFEIVSHAILDAEVVVLGRLVIDGVTKMAFGSSAVSRDTAGKPASVGGDLKAAANEALARAARLMGVGLVFEASASPEESTVATVPPNDRITQRQVGMIHGLARRMNIARAELGALLHDRFGKSDVVALSKREASDLIGDLNDANGHASR